MPAEAEILDAPMDDQQVDIPPQGEPTPDLNKQKRDAIIVQLYKKGASKDEIQAVVNHFKTLPPPIEPPKPVSPVLHKDFVPNFPADERERNAATSKALAESAFERMGGSIRDKYTKDQAELATESQKAKEKLTDAVADGVFAVKSLIKKDKMNAIRDDIANSINKPGADNTRNVKAVQDISSFLPQTAKVSDDEIINLHDAAQKDPVLYRKIVHEQMNLNPDKAKELAAAVYAVDADASGRANSKVLENIKKLKTGEIKYDVTKGMLFKPENTWESIKSGSQSTSNDLAEYHHVNDMSATEAINYMEHQYKNYDFDEPIPAPDGILSHAGSFVGREFLGMGSAAIPGAIAGSLTSMVPGGQAIAPEVGALVGAAAASPEYYQRGWINSMKSNYARLRQHGDTAEQAYDKAKDRADFDAKADVITNAAMSMVGIRAGLKTPPINFSNGFKEILRDNLKGLAKETGKEAAIIGGVGAAGQVAKNAKSGDELSTGVLDAGLQAAGMVVGMKVLLGGPKAIFGSKKEATIAKDNFAKQPDEIIHPVIGKAILDGEVTPEEAKVLLEKVDEQREINKKIGNDIIDDNTRVKIQNRFEKISQLEEQKKGVDKFTKEEINAKIERANTEIKELKDNAPEPLKVEQTPIQKGVEILNDKIEKQEDDWTKSDVYTNMAKENPQEFLKFIAEQAQSEVDGKSARGQTENDFGKDLVSQAEELYPKKKPVVTVSTPNIVNVKLKEQPPIEPEAQVTPVINEGELTGVTHAETDAVAKEMGLPTYEEKPETILEWDAEAAKRIKEDPETVNRLLNKLQKGVEPDKIEQRVMAKYLASLKAKFNETHSDEVMNEYARAKKLSDEIGGREVGKSLVARKALEPVEDSLTDFVYREMEDNNAGLPLSEKQKETVTKEYEDFKSKKDAFEAHMKSKEAEFVKREAELKIQKEVKKRKSTKPVDIKAVKKTHEDYKAERISYVKQLQELKAAAEKKLKDKGIQTMGANFTFNGDMAKVVGKMVKSLVEEGVDKLEEIVKHIHGQLKDVFEGIEERDVHDIIAGKYNDKKETRNEVAAKVQDIKTEARLINEYSDLLFGKEPVKESAAKRRNITLEGLRKKIRSLADEKTPNAKEIKEKPDEAKSKLNAIKTRLANELEKQKEKLENGDFEPEVKKPPIKLDAEGLKLKDDVLKARENIDIRRMKQMYEKRSAEEKIGRVIDEAITSARVLQTSFDVSMPFRQGLWGVAKQALALPIGENLTFKQQRQLIGQFGKMYKAVGSPTLSRRIMANIHESPRFADSQKAGLHLEDPLSKFAEERLDTYGPAYINRVPFIGKSIDLPGGGKIGGLTMASERGATVFVNSMKWDVYNNFVNIFEKQGKTFENSKDLYKAAAVYSNQVVGRGKLPIAIDKATPITKHLFFSLRLQASRLQLLTNFLNPVFYAKTPSAIRNAYLKDMVKFVALGTTVLGIAHAAGLKVGVNPYSSDFGKIHVGDTQYDIWGGFSQWAVFLTRLIRAKSTDSHGKTKDFGTGMKDENRLSLLMRFARSKSAPEASFTWNTLEGKDYLGRETNVGKESLKLISPMLGQDIYQAYQDGGVQKAIITAVLAAHGVGTQTYDNNKPTTKSTKKPTRQRNSRDRTRK